MKYDLIIIGAGSGGIATARRAHSYNKKVLLIEKGRIGGTCVNQGCVPKKITYHLASLVKSFDFAKSYGLECTFKLDFNTFVQRRDAYIVKLNEIYKSLTKDIDYIEGCAELRDRQVVVNGVSYLFDRCLLSTGAKPTSLNKPNISASHWDYVKGTEYLKTSDDFFELREVPKKCVIIGSGYISVELGFILRELGSEVTIIARRGKILSHFDEVLSENVLGAMQKIGITVHFHAKVMEVKKDGIIIETSDGQTTAITSCDFMMCCIGRDCDISYIKDDIAHKNGFLEVDDNFETTIKDVYAIGDLIGPKYMLTPYAIFCGRVLADHWYKTPVKNLKQHYRIEEAVPSVIFSHPPCASVGMSEREARNKLSNVVVHQSEFRSLFFGIVCEEHKERSVFKIVCDGERVVGCHLYGFGSDEIIQGFAVAVKMGAKYDDFKRTIPVHPTSAEEVVTMK